MPQNRESKVVFYKILSLMFRQWTSEENNIVREIKISFILCYLTTTTHYHVWFINVLSALTGDRQLKEGQLNTLVSLYIYTIPVQSANGRCQLIRSIRMIKEEGVACGKGNMNKTSMQINFTRLPFAVYSSFVSPLD